MRRTLPPSILSTSCRKEVSLKEGGRQCPMWFKSFSWEQAGCAVVRRWPEITEGSVCAVLATEARLPANEADQGGGIIAQGHLFLFKYGLLQMLICKAILFLWPYCLYYKSLSLVRNFPFFGYHCPQFWGPWYPSSIVWMPWFQPLSAPLRQRPGTCTAPTSCPPATGQLTTQQFADVQKQRAPEPWGSRILGSLLPQALLRVEQTPGSCLHGELKRYWTPWGRCWRLKA